MCVPSRRPPRGRRPRASSGGRARRRPPRRRRRARATIRGTSSRAPSAKMRVPAAVSISTPRGAAQLGRRARARRPCPPSMIDDAVADELDLVSRCELSRTATPRARSSSSRRADGAPAGRVERARRLVEEQQPRRPDERLRDPEPLLHPLRHRRRPGGRGRLGEPDELEQLAPLRCAAAASRRAAGAAAAARRRVTSREAEELGEVAERRRAAAGARRVPADRRPSPTSAARGRRRSSRASTSRRRSGRAARPARPPRSPGRRRRARRRLP